MAAPPSRPGSKAADCLMLVYLLVIATAVVSAADKVDCEMKPFVPWTKCSEACDCGIQLRHREVKTKPSGGGQSCPHDSEARTCNCGKCTKVQVDEQLLPSASSHGFTPAAFTPHAGFTTSFGEQAACVLDKAEAVIDLVPATFLCTKFSAQVGDPCYAESIKHLIHHTEMCCEGREHFVLWKSDVKCGELIAGMTQHLQDWINPVWTKCVKNGDADACKELKTEAQFNKFAQILEEGLAAAKALYAHSDSGELTAAAKAFVDICVPSANNADSWAHIKRFILNSGAKAPSGCLEKVQAFMQKYDKTHAVLSEDTRRRLLRGADSQ